MSFSKIPEDIVTMISEKLEKVYDVVSLSLICNKVNRICKEIVNLNETMNYNLKCNYEEDITYLKQAKKFNKSIRIKLRLSSNFDLVEN